MKLALRPKPKLSTAMGNYIVQNVSGKFYFLTHFSKSPIKVEFFEFNYFFISVVPNASVHSPMDCSTNLKTENIANIASTFCMPLVVPNVENSSSEELSKL